LTTKFDTLFIGKEIISLDAVNSTNDFLKQLVSEKTLKEGFVVTSEFQTAGKGQLGNQWHASKGLNFMGSILLYPHFLNLADFFYLNQIISLACIKALSDYLHSHHCDGTLNIKWPNDLYLNQKKIGGILIENSIQQSVIHQSIIGIGINLLEPSFPHTFPHATSLAIEFPFVKWDDSFENRLYLAIEYYYQIAKNNLSLTHEYIEHLMFLNQSRRYKDRHGEFIGTIKGISENGQLYILDDQNTARTYAFKEVSFVF